jgi:uncharacterized protein YjbI with pentapeptide repeats
MNTDDDCRNGSYDLSPYVDLADGDLSHANLYGATMPDGSIEW